MESPPAIPKKSNGMVKKYYPAYTKLALHSQMHDCDLQYLLSNLMDDASIEWNTAVQSQLVFLSLL